MGPLFRVAAVALSLLPGIARAEVIEVVLAHPPVDAFFACSEHWQGQLESLGDDLGKDCVVQRLVEEDGRMWTRDYATDGRTNEDWFGWNAQLLSPCACEVVRVHENPVQNEPGRLGTPPASFLILRRDDGVHFLLAHIQAPSVAKGDRLDYGDPVARIGNNGYGRSPHLHIGAWKDDKPLQIRWDQTRMKLPPEHRKPEPQESPAAVAPEPAKPKRKFISSATEQPEYRAYSRQWVVHVEKAAKRYFKEEARGRALVGRVVATVSIGRDGTLESAVVNRSSGSSSVDDAVLEISRRAAPFKPIPGFEDIDFLHITRTFVFSNELKADPPVGE